MNLYHAGFPVVTTKLLLPSCLLSVPLGRLQPRNPSGSSPKDVAAVPTSMFLSAPVPTHTANGVYHAISTLTISFVITILLVHSAFLKVIFLDLKLHEV